MKVIKLKPDQYPLLLQQISSLPKSLDLAGSLPPDTHKFLCVVGSRTHSAYGEECCYKLIEGLRGYPIVIVSGLAVGIDSVAHDAALNVGLKTLSFPGSGLSHSVLYPSMRRDLAARILENGGGLLSPFKYDQVGAYWTFPTRNRLMAGVSHATLVIEARKGSGTLITTKHALEFGRDVLAVHGSILSDLSYGPHMLIRGGATPIANSEDILQALGFQVYRKDGEAKCLPNFAEIPLTGDQRTVIEFLKGEMLSSTELIGKTSFEASKFNIVMTELELLGLVSERNGSYRLS